MSFDEIFDLTAGVYFNFYNNTMHLYFDSPRRSEEEGKHI